MEAPLIGDRARIGWSGGAMHVFDAESGWRIDLADAEEGGRAQTTNKHNHRIRETST
jgi:hypothetical protein